MIVHDILVWGKDDKEHDARLEQVLRRAREVNLKFNAKKCKIKKEVGGGVAKCRLFSQAS